MPCIRSDGSADSMKEDHSRIAEHQGRRVEARRWPPTSASWRRGVVLILTRCKVVVSRPAAFGSWPMRACAEGRERLIAQRRPERQKLLRARVRGTFARSINERFGPMRLCELGPVDGGYSLVPTPHLLDRVAYTPSTGDCPRPVACSWSLRCPPVVSSQAISRSHRSSSA